MQVVPAPREVAPGAGRWVAADSVAVTVSEPGNTEVLQLARYAAEMLTAEAGVPAAVHAGARVPGGVHLRLTSDTVASEAYTLTVTAAGLEAVGTGAGLFYALQTLRQLIESGTGGNGRVAIPAVTITDAPRFPYRGLHLDVSRHFFPASFVKRYIDLMSRYKFNTLHWHLTDDQGWRVEIMRYPRLATVASCRRETMVEKNFNPYVGDGIRHCGLYTQDEIRDVVAYARSRYVTIVPEIEMPGHAKAALAAYPELACTPGPFETRTTWGVDEDVFCPSEETFAFIEGVLTEVMELFPGRYIHIGGDEVPKTRWRASALAQDVMRREGLRNEGELQSWFIRRVERFLLQHNRRLIGWDEILEGGLAPQATVMSWRGTSGGIAAARENHDVIMTPNSPLYFDHYQGRAAFEPLAIGGFNTLDRVYAYEPVPDSLTPAQSAHILGAQANVWAEYLTTTAHVEYMVYPRALALAEVVWSPRERRSWESFRARLPVALRSLDREGVAYRIPPVEGLEGDRLTLDDHVRLTLRAVSPDAVIRYTTDGSVPDEKSARYEGPVSLPVTFEGTRVTARVFLSNGRSSPPMAATFTRTTYRSPDRVEASRLTSGLRYSYYESSVRASAAIDTLTPTREGVAAGVTRRGDERAERYALKLTGYLRVPRDAMYEFVLTSDDGSTLSIGDRIVVNNDGFHGAEEKTGMVALRAGLHPVTVRYFQGTGGAELFLRYRTNAGAWITAPSEWFVHAQ